MRQIQLPNKAATEFGISLSMTSDQRVPRKLKKIIKAIAELVPRSEFSSLESRWRQRTSQQKEAPVLPTAESASRAEA
jgi:hypothetical protein